LRYLEAPFWGAAGVIGLDVAVAATVKFARMTIDSERVAIAAELRFYREQPPPEFMVAAVEARIARLRARLEELGVTEAPDPQP
jgi:hypothetical protein